MSQAKQENSKKTRTKTASYMSATATSTSKARMMVESKTSSASFVSANELSSQVTLANNSTPHFRPPFESSAVASKVVV
jgi:hypothetical protein